MKKTAPVLFSIVFLLALASCYWRPDSNSGGLRMDLSGITSRVGNDGDVIRIYLFADGLLFSTGGGTPFVAEVPASSGSQEQKVNISGLPVGPKYRAMIGVGPVNSGMFEPSSYGDSGPFLIHPNADTSVTVSMQYISYPNYSPSFSPDLLGKNLKGLLENSYSVFTAEERNLHVTYFDYSTSTWQLQNTLDLAADTQLGVSSYRINGLSKGYLYQNAYLDSDNGILPFYEDSVWGFDTGFSVGLGGPRSIKESGSLFVPNSASDYAVFFRRDGGLGGTYVPQKDLSLPFAWKWVNVNLDGVRDLLVSGRNAYYAAGGTAFALPPAFLADDPPNLGTRRIHLPSPAPVLSLGFRPDPQGLPAGTLSLGTSDGVYRLTVDETSGAAVTASPTQITETAGDPIERIAIAPNDSYNEAYLSRQYLYIRNYFGLSKVPFFAAVPGRATGLTWDYNGTLYISGTEGLAAVYVGFYSP